MIGHEEYEAFAELYALNAMSATERERFEQHLASGCRTCEMDLGHARDVARNLAMAVPPLAPPERVRSKLLARVREDSERSATRPGRGASASNRSRSWVATGSALVAAAALILAAGLGVYSRDLSRMVAEERAARLAIEAELASARQLAEALSSPRNQAVTLQGQGPSTDARATAFVDPLAGRLFLYVENLPPLGRDQTYQIWVIVDETPTSVGTFDVSADGTARLDSQPLPDVEGLVTVAVTVEPAGGVPQPTGPIVLVGT